MISPYDAGFLFVFKARRRAHSWDSVTEAATLKTGKKTNKMGILFASKFLNITAYSGLKGKPMIVCCAGDI